MKIRYREFANGEWEVHRRFGPIWLPLWAGVQYKYNYGRYGERTISSRVYGKPRFALRASEDTYSSYHKAIKRFHCKEAAKDCLIVWVKQRWAEKENKQVLEEEVITV